MMAISIIIVADLDLRRYILAIPMKKKYCYICLHELVQTSPHNAAMCPHCGQMNYEKRLQTHDMTGHIALVTGGRIKIGYEIALKLLRANCKVIVTTRFPYDAIMRYSSEHDYDEWKGNIMIYAIDFRNLCHVTSMMEWIYGHYPYLSILINNAAQTIRRPAAYYAHLQQQEDVAVHLLKGNAMLPAGHSRSDHSAIQRGWDLMMTQRHLIEGSTSKNNFPSGQSDEYGQQLDLRRKNSWVMKIDEVHPVELVECQIVNSTVPFMLCGGLKSMMERSPTRNRFIVNVSAMEGCFSKVNKNCYHPHTNMAKAALNMITRTIAEDYANRRIFVTSVDTGWVTNENPEHIKREQLRRGIYAPLDCIDGAARVLDPVFSGAESDSPLYGVFLKDYHTINW